MAVGFILISSAPSQEHDVYSEIQKLPHIKELYPLFGEFDMIAKIEARNYDELWRIVTNDIRAVEGIIHTETLCGSVKP